MTITSEKELDGIIRYYTAITDTLREYNNEFIRLDNKLVEKHAVSTKSQSFYIKRVQQLRIALKAVMVHKKLNLDLPKTETKCVTVMKGLTKLVIEIPPFILNHYLQKCDSNGRYLFYNVDPNTMDYSEIEPDEKVHADNIYSYGPCKEIWFYKHGTLITDNYSLIIRSMNKDMSYDDLLHYRLILKDEYKKDGKKTVDAYGKYRFSYKNEDLIVKNQTGEPVNNPEIEGVSAGSFSFIDNIDTKKWTVASTTVQNTIHIINHLINKIKELIKDLSAFTPK